MMNNTSLLPLHYKLITKLNLIMNIKTILSVGAIALVLFSSCSKVEEPKNVLFILADDYGYNDMSCRSSEFYETPNIDRIAAEGTVFTDGYAACQVCSPSRASIMTGKFPARHGITDWIGAKSGEAWRTKNRHSKLLPAGYVHSLDLNYTTLPEAMKENGYITFFAGKWHIGEKGSWPEDHGFDINKGGWDAGSPSGGYFAPYNNPNLKSGPDGENLSMRLAQETVDFMKANKDNKFFAYLSFYAVHGPVQASQEKWEKYRKKAIANGVAESGYEMGKFLPIRTTQDQPIYGGLVETMDDAVGYVLKALEDLGLEDNTMVVFTSDNGGVSSGDSFSTSNAPLREGKGSQYEGGIREPYFIKVPWLKGAIKESHYPVSGTDFYPTILDLIGAELKPDAHNDGVSLLPLLTGGELVERPLIWHYPHYGNQGGEPSSIIRLGDWKLIHYYEDGREELYNLPVDISETNDVAAENAELVASLSKQLFDYLTEVGARFPEIDPEYNATEEAEYLEKIRTVKMKQLEKQRINMLKEDFKPNKDWWGSQVTRD